MNSIANVFRTKEELYTLLQNHGGYYLPPLVKTPCQFLRDFLVGKKLLLKLKDVETTGKIPRFEEFGVKNIWDLVKDKLDFKPYFPDIPAGSKNLPDRDYLLNVVNTLEADLITTIFAESMKKRQELNFKERETDRVMEIKPELFELIMNSDQRSSKKGKLLNIIQKKSVGKIKKPKKKKFTALVNKSFKLEFKNL